MQNENSLKPTAYERAIADYSKEKSAAYEQAKAQAAAEPKSFICSIHKDIADYIDAKIKDTEEYIAIMYKGTTVPSAYLGTLRNLQNTAKEAARSFKKEDMSWANRENSNQDRILQYEVEKHAEINLLIEAAKTYTQEAETIAQLSLREAEIDSVFTKAAASRDAKSGDSKAPKNAAKLDAERTAIVGAKAEKITLLERLKAAIRNGKEKFLNMVEAFKQRGVWEKVLKLRADFGKAWELVKGWLQDAKELAEEAGEIVQQAANTAKEVANDLTNPNQTAETQTQAEIAFKP